MLQLPKHSQAKNCITYSAATVEQTKHFHLPANEKNSSVIPKRQDTHVSLIPV